MTKYIVGSTVVLVALGIFFLNGANKTAEYVKETVTVTETKEIDALEAAVQEAINASSTEIEAAAKKAYDDAKRQAEVEIELAVTAEYRAKLQAREKELQKESVAY